MRKRGWRLVGSWRDGPLQTETECVIPSNGNTLPAQEAGMQGCKEARKQGRHDRLFGGANRLGAADRLAPASKFAVANRFALAALVWSCA